VPEVDRDDLVAHLDEFLAAGSGRDYCPNGLQVEGRVAVGKIVVGVSACQELFEEAAQQRADAVLVHHGLFWEKDPRPLVGLLYRRIRILIDAGINLIAYHLPLDRHDQVGNNILAAHRFGISRPEPFGEYDGLSIGFGGTLDEPMDPEAFALRCEEVFGQRPMTFAAGPDRIDRAAFVSGAAENLLHEAVAQGYDAFVTGEVSEWVMNVARESGVHFFAAGHYATERLGVQALGDHVARTFGIDVDFVDVPNPV